MAAALVAVSTYMHSAYGPTPSKAAAAKGGSGSGASRAASKKRQ